MYHVYLLYSLMIDWDSPENEDTPHSTAKCQNIPLDALISVKIP